MSPGKPCVLRRGASTARDPRAAARELHEALGARTATLTTSFRSALVIGRDGTRRSLDATHGAQLDAMHVDHTFTGVAGGAAARRAA